MKAMTSTIVKIVIFTVAMLLILILTMQALTRPPSGKLDTFHADFKDASGLKVGDDVRLLGVQVGKVTDIAVKQSSDHRLSNAQVTFSVQRERVLKSEDQLAIRYQNLTGSRFVEVERSSNAGAQPMKAGATFPEKQTQSSFDITTVFVGLKPVLSTLNADDINHLSQSVLAVIQGNGDGLAPLLSSLDKLMAVTNDRQRVLTQLITNLGSVSQSIGGASPGLTGVIKNLELLGRSLASNVDSMREWSDKTSGVVSSTNALLAALGLTPNENPPLDAIVSNAMPIAEQLVNALATLPGIVQLLNEGTKPQANGAVSLKCTNGQAKLPGMMNLFVAGQKVTNATQSELLQPADADGETGSPQSVELGIVGALIAVIILAARRLPVRVPAGHQGVQRRLQGGPGRSESGVDVRVAGISVGKVSGVDLMDDRVRVKFRVDNNIFIATLPPCR